MKNSIYKIFYAITLLTVASITFASKSSRYDFPSNVTVTPLGAYAMPLKNLSYGTIYDITCNVTNPNSEEIIVTFVNNGFSSAPFYQVYVDDPQKKRMTGASNIHLKNGSHIINLVTIMNFNSNSFINLTNVDQDNTLTVDSCWAVAE